jgi:hypothetical protein
MSLFDQLSQRLSSSISSIGSTIASRAAGSAIVGAAVGKLAPGAAGVVRAIERGDANALLGAGVNAIRNKLGIKSPLSNPTAAHLYFQASPNPLLGGLTPQEAARIAAEVRAGNHARKNLWFIEIRDPNPPKGYEDISKTFNLFATDVNLGPWTISSEAKQIGTAVMDMVTGTERTEMRITTFDDAAGTIRGWFDGKAKQVARSDGTVGLPADYLIGIRLIESAVNDATMQAFGGYETEFAMRVTSLETELSRGEEGLQQLQLVFTEFDTFMFQGRP